MCLWFAYRVPGGAVTASVVSNVRASVNLRPSRRGLGNGERVVLSGRVRSAPIPRSGVFVALQARRAGRWQTFATARSRRSGAFRSSYTFRRTFQPTTYRLRALVPRQAAYPFAAGASRSVAIRVR
jgi:hypothetical protein